MSKFIAIVRIIASVIPIIKDLIDKMKNKALGKPCEKDEEKKP